MIRAALFGSVARGRTRPDSDIDVLVELDPERPIDLFASVEIARFIEDLFSLPVDIANRARLKALVRSDMERDAISAF